jgi:hypothetical protein
MRELPLLSPKLPAPGSPTRYTLPVPWNKLALLLPMPLPCSVGMLTLDDALSRLELKGPELQREQVDKEFTNQVSGGRLHAMVPPGPQTLAWLQSRVIVLYDLEWKDALEYWVVGDLEEVGSAARWISSEPRVAAIRIEDSTNYLANDRLDYRFRSYRLEVGEKGDEDGESVLLGTLELGAMLPASSAWDAGGGLLALIRSGQLEVYGPELGKPKPEHPLALAAGKLLKEGGLTPHSVRLHPTRPLALLALGRTAPPSKKEEQTPAGVWCVDWGSKAPQLVPLVELPVGQQVQLGGFSPKGDWVYYRAESAMRMHLYVQQLGDTPGKPLYLGELPSSYDIFWTREPTALVALERVPDGLSKLVRWNMAQPPAAPGKAKP